ncbi:MAG TPA: prenyltransferase [Bacteroidales bacterium]|nr:prenyltransferase [Bacteroidales bacterium]
MIYFLQLIRYKNLLIIVLTQYLMRWCVIRPILSVYDFELRFSEINFFFLVFSTVLITAAGYVINDYFDTKTDLLNRPEKVLIDKSIHRRTAILIHVVLNTLGIGLGAYISFYIGIPILSLVFVFITGILWFYSTTYKRQFLIGNIIVAILTALVPLMVILFEIPLLNKTYGSLMIEMRLDFNLIVIWVSAFAFYAFLLTLIREIIKDVEDFEGDNAYGRQTLPIALGVLNTKIILVSLILLVLFSLVFAYIRFLTDNITLIYFVVFLLFPLLVLFYKIIIADNKKDYHFASSLSKIIMLAGIMYALVVNYIINQNISL